MHPLHAAQTTAELLHSLVQQHEPASADEQLVIDAVIALHQWTLPKRQSVPVRLRLRPSLPLQLRLRPPGTEVATIINRGTVRRPRNRNSRLPANANLNNIRFIQQSGAPTPISTKGRLGAESQPRSSSHIESQEIHASDLSTEPPEGWPKLSAVSLPALPSRNDTLEDSGKLDGKDDEFSKPAEAKQLHQHGDGSPQAENRHSPVAEEREESAGIESFPLSSSPKIQKRRRIVQQSSCKAKDTETLNPSTPTANMSEGSERGVNSATNSRGMDGFCKGRDGFRKTSTSKRKSSTPKRRRTCAEEHSSDSSFVNDSECEAFRQMTSGEGPSRVGSESWSPVGVDSGDERCDRYENSHSYENKGPAQSYDSVIIGSNSYDGGSVDRRYDSPDGKRSKLLSRPSSVVWTESRPDTIEDTIPGDQTDALTDAPTDNIEETANVSPAEKPPDTRVNSSCSKSIPAYETSTETTQAAKKKSPADTTSIQGKKMTSMWPSQSTKSRPSTNIASSPSEIQMPVQAGTYTDLQTIKSSSRTTFDQKVPKLDEKPQVPSHPPTSRISPVSLAELPADSRTRDESCQEPSKPSRDSETIVSEMVVCSTGFTNEAETDLAQELVMRLGGEFTPNLDGVRPECVVAPIHPETKALLSQNMIILFALARHIPIVGLSWLVQCFHSGCWIDPKDFEIPLSKLGSTAAVFHGVVATFEDAFFRKNAKKKCREYRERISSLIELTGGMIAIKSDIKKLKEARSFTLHIQIAYDFENEPLRRDIGGIMPRRVVNKNWIAACIMSGRCPPLVDH